MADLTQNVKYVVDVDLSALDKLRLAMEQVIATAKGLDASFSRTQRATKAAMDGSTAATNRSKDAIEGHAAATVAAGRKEETAIERVQRLRFEAHVEHINRMEKEKAAHLKKIEAENRAYNAGMRNLKAYTDYANRASKEVTDGLQMRFLKVFGTFQALRYTTQQVFASIKEGAQSLDLDRVLGTQLQNFTGMMEDARRATAGMVGDAGLKKSIALMTSFGIPTQGMADSLGLVQKMAIRTGQSAEFLTESFARGISRLSPLILDNLGIQVSLKDANEAYAKSIGKTTDELTKAEQTTALLNETLRLLRKNTEGIDLEASAGAAVARAEALWDNITNSVKEGAATGAVALEQMFAGAGTNAKFVSTQLAEISTQVRAQKDAVPGLADRYQALAKTMSSLAVNDDLVKLFEGRTTGEFFGTTPKGILNTASVLAHDVIPSMEVMQRALELYNATWLQNKDLLEESQFIVDKMLIPDVIFRNIQAADDAAKAQLETYKQMLAAQGITLTKAEEESKLTELRKANEEAILGALGRAQRIHGNNNQALAQQLIHLLNSGVAYEAITDALRAQAALFAENSKKQREAMAVMDARLRQHEKDIEYNTRREAILDGQIRAEVELGDIKAKLAAADERHAEALASVREALNDADRKAALDNADAARAARDIAATAYNAARIFNEQQQAYLDSFKGKNATIIKQEVDKLRTQAEQLRTQAAMLEVMLRIQAAGKDINVEQVRAFQLQADNAESMAKRLEGSIRGGGGGGRAPGPIFEKTKVPKAEEREFRDYIERMAEASDTARNLMDTVQMQGRNMFSPFGSDMGTALGVDPGDIKEQLAALKEIEAQYERFADIYGAGAADAFFDGTGWDLDTMVQAKVYLGEMADHMERMRGIGDSLNDVASVMDSFAAGMDGLFGDDIIASTQAMTAALEQLSAAFTENAGAYDLVIAGIPAMRAFTSFFVKDMRTKAWIEMAMQAAASWAAFATGNVPKGVMHATAATMYGLVAGGVLRLPKGKSKDDTAGSSERAMPLRRDVHVHISGPIATTEAERGAMIRDAIRAAEREGI